VTHEPSILVLGTADWDATIATNQHFVSVGLAQLGQVEFVESLGLRRPGFNVVDCQRIFARAMAQFGRVRSERARRSVPDAMRVNSAVVVPFHGRATARVNRCLVRLAARKWLNGFGPKVLYAFTPTTYGLEEDSDVCVYHCVDLLARVPGINSRVIDRHESLLARSADLAIATSSPVARHLQEVPFQTVELLPNVADVDLFAARAEPAERRKRHVVFAGNLVGFKVDFDLLHDLVNELPAGAELILAGPSTTGSKEDQENVERLTARGVRWTGALSQDALADLLGSAMVGLIPYRLTDYTLGVSPLKVYEYLAAGLGVVSTALPEVKAVADDLHVFVSERPSFVDSVLALLAVITNEDIHTRQALASGHSWPARLEVIRSQVSELLERNA
jgi:teichuronic acid biosynthesis glycosyltransferase TuaH